MIKTVTMKKMTIIILIVKRGNIFNIVVVIYTLLILNSTYNNARVGSF